MFWPDIDVIIPTFNSAGTLGECLEGIRKQKYLGNIKIKIIDGGSTDNTIEIASAFHADIEIKDGMYGTGKNGARHYGEMVTSSPFVWNVDSDNILVEEHVLERLIYPLLEDKGVNISIPFPAIDPTSSSFNQWLTLEEIENVSRMVRAGKELGNGYVFLTDMFYGLTNCAVIRRSVLEICGGYDSDVRLLSRIRAKHLSQGIVDKESHFYHNQTRSIFEYVKKWDRRIKFFASMSESQLKDYFFEYPPNKEYQESLQRGLVHSLYFKPFYHFYNFLVTRNKYWLWAFPYSLILSTYGLIHPYRSYRVIKKFL